MAKKRTPQTFEKRQRERDKQLKREAKKADRLARTAAKRDAHEQGDGTPQIVEAEEHPDRVEDETTDSQRQ